MQFGWENESLMFQNASVEEEKKANRRTTP